MIHIPHRSIIRNDITILTCRDVPACPILFTCPYVAWIFNKLRKHSSTCETQFSFNPSISDYNFDCDARWTIFFIFFSYRYTWYRYILSIEMELFETINLLRYPFYIISHASQFHCSFHETECSRRISSSSRMQLTMRRLLHLDDTEEVHRNSFACPSGRP